MKLSSEDILKRWNNLMAIINDHFEGHQKENIVLLFNHFEDRFIDAPASSRPTFHNCFPGGLLDHTVRVINTALDLKNQFEKMGVDVTANNKDIVLSAMFHDLGKIGDLNDPYYIIQTNDWRRDKLNEWYTFNEEVLEPMSVTDRSLWLLQQFDIKISSEVWKAIKLSDGMFDDGNVRAFKKPDTNRNILHYIIHFADWISTVAEKQHRRQYMNKENTNDSTKKIVSKEVKKNNTNIDNMKKKFDELFGD